MPEVEIDGESEGGDVGKEQAALPFQRNSFLWNEENDLPSVFQQITHRKYCSQVIRSELMKADFDNCMIYAYNI